MATHMQNTEYRIQSAGQIAKLKIWQQRIRSPDFWEKPAPLLRAPLQPACPCHSQFSDFSFLPARPKTVWQPVEVKPDDFWILNPQSRVPNPISIPIPSIWPADNWTYFADILINLTLGAEVSFQFRSRFLPFYFSYFPGFLLWAQGDYVAFAGFCQLQHLIKLNHQIKWQRRQFWGIQICFCRGFHLVK